MEVNVIKYWEHCVSRDLPGYFNFYPSSHTTYFPKEHIFNLQTARVTKSLEAK